ncbi:MFS transporter, partial [Rasamsonia emersonii CBS 393.64]
MASKQEESNPQDSGPSQPQRSIRAPWRRFLGVSMRSESESEEDLKWSNRSKWTLGILSDKETDEVPGTVLLLASNRNQPLGLKHQPARTSASSLPSPYPPSRSSSRSVVPKKRTPDGRIVLEPQPDDSLNDPLNWPKWRRDAALLSLGFYCMMGGGMTPVLAAGFGQVAQDYAVTTQQVAYTTGLYMMGLGLGSVIMAPTAILWGKRPIYLLGATLFILSAVWCALSPNYPSLVVARIFQGLAVSPVECLPSATIAEIFFLHERAYRVGIYTLLLLGGKNLVPLVSAAIIESRGWRWVFWVVAMIVGGCLLLLFFFVPETFWDRTPRPRDRSKRPKVYRSVSDLVHHGFRGRHPEPRPAGEKATLSRSPSAAKRKKDAHVGFVDSEVNEKQEEMKVDQSGEMPIGERPGDGTNVGDANAPSSPALPSPAPVSQGHAAAGSDAVSPAPDLEAARPVSLSPLRSDSEDHVVTMNPSALYTHRLRERPPVPYIHTLRPWNGRLAQDKWLRVAVRPFILFTYPAVLWSALVYSLSVGWLIVLSESVAHIYQGRKHIQL